MVRIISNKKALGLGQDLDDEKAIAALAVVREGKHKALPADKKERRRRIDRNKIEDEKNIRWMKQLKENATYYEKLVKKKEKQVDALLQHI